MNHLKLCYEKLDIGAINDLVADESCGAISTFAGTTRDNFEGKKVLHLEYEAYESMALKSMTKICTEMRSKWPDIKHIAIYHRLGTVSVKEASVVISVSSPHRQTSLQSVQFAIDELKATVPIWKKEQYENDKSAWKENKELKHTKNEPPVKRVKLNLDSCTLEMNPISKNLIQITADEQELFRRIQCFVEKKREEIDVNNILDFTTTKPDELNMQNDENMEDTSKLSCARINGVIPKYKNLKTHLKVERVKNEIGPQDKLDYTETLDKLMLNSDVKIKEEDSMKISAGITERIENIEKHLNVKPAKSKDIFKRLKAVENKILFLEAISPEYHHYLTPEVTKQISKKSYSIEDLDKYISRMKENLEKCKQE